jgi:hypothetical protein
MIFICLYGINYRISIEWDNPVDVGQEVSVVSGQFRHMVRNDEQINTILILFGPLEKC